MDDLAAIEAKGGVLEAIYEAREKITRAIGITCHADPQALQTAPSATTSIAQMALNAGLASITEAMKLAPARRSPALNTSQYRWPSGRRWV